MTHSVDGKVTDVDDRVRGVEGRVQGVRDDVQDVDNIVQDVDDRIQGIDSNVRGVDDKLDQANSSLSFQAVIVILRAQTTSQGTSSKMPSTMALAPRSIHQS